MGKSSTNCNDLIVTYVKFLYANGEGLDMLCLPSIWYSVVSNHLSGKYGGPRENIDGCIITGVNEALLNSLTRSLTFAISCFLKEARKNCEMG